MPPPDVMQIDAACALPRATSAGERDAFAVVVPAEVWDAIDAHATSRRDAEVGGVLLGKVCRRPDDSLYLLIDGHVSALAATSRGASVTFTADAWTHIHDVIDRERPGATIVGWYHTHPNFGIFLSEMDLFIQRHFFDAPHHVAIVIDPISRERGAFVWRDGAPTLQTIHIEGDARNDERPLGFRVGLALAIAVASVAAALLWSLSGR